MNGVVAQAAAVHIRVFGPVVLIERRCVQSRNSHSHAQSFSDWHIRCGFRMTELRAHVVQVGDHHAEFCALLLVELIEGHVGVVAVAFLSDSISEPSVGGDSTVQAEVLQEVWQQTAETAALVWNMERREFIVWLYFF